ncbi:polyphosphate--glucose phosphotransferase [Actinomadura atramentaria]|uniref:polyphosphate--glucose phosphotransferase n=1 Tax=Actinomadura atramentaria TaxID=1990 RepID=UPI000361EE1B|nr:ROK family protein [Actinomadura atramentaria]
MSILGIDIGGSAVKGAPVDTAAGTLTADRLRIAVTRPAAPETVAEAVAAVAARFPGAGPVGVTFPGVVRDGVALTAANLDDRWIGADAAALFAAATGRPVTVLNDADAAGVAEMRFGAGRGRTGTVLVLTLGTGIGSALFTEGVLVPNTEFGHLELEGFDAETRAAARVREEEHLDWPAWAERLAAYLRYVEKLVSPELIVLGGGVSRRADRFVPLVTGVRAPVVPAVLGNAAGTVGAALAAAAAA